MARPETTRGIIGRLVEVSTKHPKGVDKTLNIATVVVALAILAVTIETARELRDSIYGQRVGQQIGVLVGPAIQNFIDATQRLGQQMGQGPLAPR